MLSVPLYTETSA